MKDSLAKLVYEEILGNVNSRLNHLFRKYILIPCAQHLDTLMPQLHKNTVPVVKDLFNRCCLDAQYLSLMDEEILNNTLRKLRFHITQLVGIAICIDMYRPLEDQLLKEDLHFEPLKKYD